MSPVGRISWDCSTTHHMIERDFDIPFVAQLAQREKQIQQNYRPVIGIHKWFARRLGRIWRLNSAAVRYLSWMHLGKTRQRPREGTPVTLCRRAVDRTGAEPARARRPNRAPGERQGCPGPGWGQDTQRNRSGTAGTQGMSHFYLDASVVVKRYSPETGSVWVKTLTDTLKYGRGFPYPSPSTTTRSSWAITRSGCA